MSFLAELGRSQPICANLRLGAGGTILDANNRVICTMNLAHNGLSLSEAFVYANILIAGASNFDLLAAAHIPKEPKP